MPTFAAGQRWIYRTRASEPRSTLVIGAIETYPSQGEVVHIAVEAVASDTSTEPATIGHMPFSDQAIRSSVTELAAEGVEAPEHFKDGLAEWRRAEGGVFTIAVAAAIDAVVGAVSSEVEDDSFDDLVAEMRNTSSPELIESVYDNLFALPKWVFLAAPDGGSGVMAWVFPDGPVTTPAALAFTSTAKALTAAKELGLTDPMGNPELLPMTIEEVLERIDGPGLGVDWLCFNMTHEEFPLVANQARRLYRSRIV